MTARDKPESAVAWDQALEGLGGDREVLKVVVDAVLEEGPILLKRVEQAVAACDAAALRQAAHALRGSVLLLAPTQTGELVQRLEVIGGTGRCEGAAELLPMLVGKMQELLDELSGPMDVG